MLLMVEKGIRERIFNAIYIYATVSNKYMKKYNKDKESPSIKYLDENNLYGWALPQKLPADGFEWKEQTSKFNGIAFK